MSDYSLINILEVEDQSTGDDGTTKRFTRKYLDSRDLGVSLFTYPPNFKAEKAHSHKEQEEAYVVVKGSGHILLNEKVLDLKMWDVIRVAPEVTRAFAAGPDGLDLIIVGGPKPDGGDGVRQTPNWPS
jgi:mannose-6-phosphate isomerase-like protein (cupin superfamily)